MPLDPIKVHASDGTVVQSIKRFASLSPLSTSVGLATGTSQGPAHQEVEYTGKNGSVIRATGRMLLDVVRTLKTVNRTGARLGYYSLDPAALGSRLAVLAKTFQQHKAIKCRVSYVTCVPATSTGAIAMYFQNDISQAAVTVGTDELRHAATHDQFIQIPIWQNGSMKIKPSDLNLRYNNDVTSPSNSTQGAIVIESADDLEPDVPIGNLYLEYEYDFYASALDYQESNLLTPTLTWFVNSVSGATLSGAQFAFPFYALPTGAANLNFSTDAGGNLNYYILVIEDVQNTSGTNIDSLTWFTPKDPTARFFERGQSFFLGLVTNSNSNNFGNGTIQGVLFAGFPDVSSIVTLSASTSAGIIEGAIKFRSRAVPISY
jgi:hypothetical protein